MPHSALDRAVRRDTQDSDSLKDLRNWRAQPKEELRVA